jgi:hypothetical protein
VRLPIASPVQNMVQRSLVPLLAALGGILVVVGGLLGALLSIGPARYGMPFGGMWSALVLGLLAVVFGLVILAYSGAALFGGVPRNLSGGIIHVVLGVVTWVVVGGWILVAIGAFLTIVAGMWWLGELFLSESGVSLKGSA